MLGYPGETSKALDADHHGVCKYDSPGDPNYITVRNVLKSIMSKIVVMRKSSQLSVPDRRQSSDLKAMLSVEELPDIDYIFFQDQRAIVTNEWILSNEAFMTWSNTEHVGHRMIWLHGAAAAGKSVASSFIVDHLVKQRRLVQYFFIRFGDQKKRSLSAILRSLAYQIARSVPQFARMLADLGSEAIDFGTADARTIWEHIFKRNLFMVQSLEAIFWIIDGLDEADDPRNVIRIISDVSSSSTPIRLLFASRKTS